MTRTWTPEQEAVLASREQMFVVRASAGSGKTSVLTEKYLRAVIQQGLRPDQILCVTYTKKAAVEMKTRIVNGLQQAGRWDEAQIAETGPISTIHSFYERTLREYAFFAGIDPEFDVVTGIHSERIFQSALESALEEELDRKPLVRQAVDFLAGKVRWKGVSEQLPEHVQRILGNLRESHHPYPALAALYEMPWTYERRIYEEVRALLPPDLRDQFSEIEPDFPDQLAKAIEVYNKENRAKLKIGDWFAPPPLGEKWTKDAELTVGLCQLVLSVWRRYDQLLQDRAVLDITALERRAIDLIEEKDEVRDQLIRRYRLMMIDECQDVNPIQYRLLDRLPLEQVMLVGDPQQSIFGFRGADHRLFVRRSRDLPALTLSKNFRSDAGILRFVDDFFAAEWGANYQPMAPIEEQDPFGGRLEGDYSGVECWWDSQNIELVAVGIAQLIEEGQVPGGIAALVETNSSGSRLRAALQARGIAAHLNGQSEKFYVGMVVRDLANALEAVADPTRTFSMLALLHSPFVGLSLDSVVLLSREEDVLASLVEFEPSVPEDREKLNQFLRWFGGIARTADRHAAWEVIADLFRETPFLAQLARRPDATQALANARKLFMIATEEPDLGPLAFAEQIRQIQRLGHKIPEPSPIDNPSDSVAIYTMHKAKGLEFDVVVVAECHQVRRSPSIPLVDRDSGLVAHATGSHKSPGKEVLKKELERREQEEHLRLFYVALTRAKKKLCLALSSSGKGVGGKLASKFGLPRSPEPGIKVRHLQLGIQDADKVGKLRT